MLIDSQMLRDRILNLMEDSEDITYRAAWNDAIRNVLTVISDEIQSGKLSGGADPVIERDNLWRKAIENTQYKSDCLKLNVFALLAEVHRLCKAPTTNPNNGGGG